MRQRLAESERAFRGTCAGRPAHIGFRPITDADAPFLRALFVGTRLDELKPVPWPDEVKLAFLRDQFERQHRYYHETFAQADFSLILHDATPIGRIYVDRAATEINLIEVSLLPEWRGRGLGTALIAELLAEAQAARCAVVLQVETHNPAYRLYTRCGFEHVEDGGIYQTLRWTPRAA